jgi:hypothetical protein
MDAVRLDNYMRKAGMQMHSVQVGVNVFLRLTEIFSDPLTKILR